MTERLSSAHEINNGNELSHDPELAAKFGQVVMEGMGANAFAPATPEYEPFGADLVEPHKINETELGSTPYGSANLPPERTWVLKVSTDWL